MSTPPGGRADNLGYLLKHAWLRLAEATAPELAPFGIDGRELGVLTVLAGGDPLSQQEAARRLDVDRTTMVALIDGLEAKKLVERRPHPQDRRKNIVEPTAAGREVLRKATRVTGDIERRFLAPLSEADAERLKAWLRILNSAAPARSEPGPPPARSDRSR